jgi:hypothetical protein
MDIESARQKDEIENMEVDIPIDFLSKLTWIEDCQSP